MTDNNTKLSLSLTINGISEDKKRNNLFQNLINKNIDVTLLQETHSTKKNIDKWEKEWPGQSFWNSGKISKTSGVGILIKKDLNIKLYNRVNNEGKILSLNFSIEKENFQIQNTYAPVKHPEKPKILSKNKKIHRS